MDFLRGPFFDPKNLLMARFLRSLPPHGPPQCVIEKVSTSKCAFIVSSTLHVRPHYLYTRNELNFIALVTKFQLVEKVRIHTFHLRFYLTARRVHVRIIGVRWELVKLILRFVNRGPFVIKKGRVERAIKITFDDFLKPTVEAWRSGLPYYKILQGDRKSTRLNSSHSGESRMPSSA